MLLFFTRNPAGPGKDHKSIRSESTIHDLRANVTEVIREGNVKNERQFSDVGKNDKGEPAFEGHHRDPG